MALAPWGVCVCVFSGEEGTGGVFQCAVLMCGRAHLSEHFGQSNGLVATCLWLRRRSVLNQIVEAAHALGLRMLQSTGTGPGFPLR